MNSKRLLRVADLMEVTPRKDFNLASNENCAIGNACRLSYFKRIGLKYDPTEDVIRFDIYFGHTAIAKLFGISHAQAEALFCGTPVSDLYKSDNPTPKQVAKVIRKFVATHAE